MRLNADNLSKQNDAINNLEWVRELPIVSYGYVRRVIDDCTVEVSPVVQRSKELLQTFTVTLLSLSSALCEVKIQPKLNDLVLLFSLNKYDRKMFNDVASRPAGEEVLIHPDQNGYTFFSMTGILAKTFKSMAAICADIMEDEDGKPTANIAVDAMVNMNASKDVTFAMTSKDGKAYSFNLLIDEFHPGSMVVNAPMNHETGLKEVADGKAQEVAAPIYRKVHGKSPVDLDVRSPVTIRVGRGNAESGSADESRSAPVSVDLGDSADISVTSGSGLSMTFKKALSIVFDGAVDIISKAAIQLMVQGSGKLKIGNNTSTLLGILDEYNSILSSFDTVGSPAKHMTGPGAKAKLSALKSKQGQVFS